MCTELEQTILKNIITAIEADNKITFKSYEQIAELGDNKDLILNIIKKEITPTNHKIIQNCVQSQKLSEAIFNKISRQQITNVCFPKEFKDKIDWTKYTIRHYTSVDPILFNGTIKSNLALTTEKDLLGIPNNLNTSGHTTQRDWNIIGNVGDTFYCLYYKGGSATGKTPNFISDAYKYYIEWSIEEFGNCWASSDYLSFTQKIINSFKEKKFFPIQSYSGDIKDVIMACIFSETKAIMPWLPRLDNPAEYLKAYDNFEIKKHGSMKFNNYYARRGNQWVNIRWDDDDPTED